MFSEPKANQRGSIKLRVSALLNIFICSCRGAPRFAETWDFCECARIRDRACLSEAEGGESL